MAATKVKARFLEPMLLLRSESLPESIGWQYELKWDGFRALAIKTDGKVQLRSRNDNDFTSKYPRVVEALGRLSNETVLDGEVVVLDQAGRPSFNLLQNYGSSNAPVYYYVFDVPILAGRDLRSEPLHTRRDLLEQRVLPKVQEPVRYSVSLSASLPELMQAVREQGVEGLVAKRQDSVYESGQRSGAWRKMRLNQGQEFVIGGYTPSLKNFDALIFGYYEGEKLLYAARTRNGFTPALREQLFPQIKRLETRHCPFINLPEPRGGRWGQGLTAAKMKECRWLEPTLVAQFQFLEWTPDHHLRHTKFIALRDDKDPRQVTREIAIP